MVSIRQVAPSAVAAHPLNPRATRPATDIERLADRMKRIGFEATRAPWVVADGDGLLVFAGATRVLAAQSAGLDTIPVAVHNGLTPEDVVRLADQDNESDEYHVRVPLLDVWASYAALAEAGWTQDRIAKAKGVDRSTVANRLRFHRDLPKAARKAVLGELLGEQHCQEILSVVLGAQHSAWLTTDQARDELLREVTVSAPDTKKRGKGGPTVEMVREAAARWKALIEHVSKATAKLPAAHRAGFVAALGKAKARTVHAVDAALAAVYADIEAEEATSAAAARNAASDADRRAEEARLEKERAEAVRALVSKVHHGDARDLVADVPSGYRLLLTDPPYGIGLGAGRSTKTKRAAIAGDASIEEAVALLDAVLPTLFARMAEHGTALIFTGWQHEPAFRDAIQRAGFAILGSLVWVKNNHGIGNTSKGFAPKHERIIHAVKGAPDLRGERRSDVFEAPANQKTIHPTEKPAGLLRDLIGSCSSRGEVVADPFAGSGSTLVAAQALGRDIWGCEIEARWVEMARGSLVRDVAAAAE